MIRKLPLPVTLAILAALAVTWRMGTQHWLTYHTGSQNTPGSPPNYNFWSGFGSDLGEYAIVASLAGHLALVWRQRTCHRYWWCWRHPHYPLEGTPYMLCRRHHPDDIPSVADAVESYQQEKAA
jgi:hypothetical protein